ncbi:Golgi membrane protein YIP1 family [Trichomonas vaginalis G3]|uniref:Golgi membrane protein YIP1 family n=1 Tax=Trichomonas vaginalis (strain ATCC PRA-98 / G3) TaxID=412133 RepID=UPI0021E5CD42|nr:Golgi membrane protein YIP1 family [Trichomonas vaginalis G3]KAI5485289.1 Golgi membrane protein YIP1 family [Trichomonas vaginalis G3]
MIDQNEPYQALSEEAESALLNETVWETINRDLNEIKSKVLIVLNPKSSSDTAFRDWDLWGPMFFTLFLAVSLALSGDSSQTSVLFTDIFSICSFGGAFVTINFILLGGTSGFFPAFCALGYCLFPVCISALICSILSIIFIRLLACAGGLYWSSIAIRKFLQTQIPDDKRILGLYPCILFYAIITWVIFVH